MSNTPKLILIRESVLQSWLRDVGTLGALAVLPWFNYTYCGGSGWINFAIAFAWIISILARASGQRKQCEKTPAQARAWLDENFPAPPEAEA